MRNFKVLRIHALNKSGIRTCRVGTVMVGTNFLHVKKYILPRDMQRSCKVLVFMLKTRPWTI